MKLSRFREKTSQFTRKINDSKKKILESRKESDFEKKTKLFANKLFQVLKKNYFVATRNPKLYFSLIIAPLLFVILIGLAFNTSQLRLDLKMSIYDETPDQIILNVFNELKRVEAINVSSEAMCKENTLNKKSVVCIAIQENNESKFDVNIYFDYSRMSVYPTAYSIVVEVFNAFERELTINLLSELREQVDPSRFDFEEVQKDLNQTERELINASEKINLLASSLSSDSAFYQYKLDEVIQELQILDAQINEHQELLIEYRRELRKQRAEVEEVYNEINRVTINVKELADECEAQGQDLSNQLENSNFVDLINMQDNPGCSTIKTIHGAINSYTITFKEIRDGFVKAEQDLDEIYYSLEELKTKNNNYINELEQEKQQITEAEEFYSIEITDFKERLLQHSDKVAEYSVMVSKLNDDVSNFYTALDPRELVNKFRQNIQLISDTRNLLDYSLHLVIPFILLLSTLLISITLNRNEYKTTARQRNKMLKNNFLIFTGNTIFILIVMLLELIFILFLFNFFFGSNTLQNFSVVLISASVFILIWAVVGFLISRNINSDEGAIFSGTIIGLIFFFLSDVIVPVESFHEIMIYLYNMNPFVYFSEIIRNNYLTGTNIALFNFNFIFLLTILIVILLLSISIIWRDLHEHAS